MGLAETERVQTSGDGGTADGVDLEGSPAGVPRRLRWPRLVLGGAVGVAGGAVTIALFQPGILRELRTSGLGVEEPWFIVLAVLAAVFAYVCDALALILLVRRIAPRVSRRQVAAISLEGTMIGGVTSFGGMEVPYKVVMIRGAGVPGAQAASAIVLKGLVRVTPLGLLGLLALLPIGGSPLDPAQRWGVVAVAMVFIALWAAGWYLVRRPHHASFLPAWARDRVVAGISALHAYRRAGWSFWARLALLQSGYWVGMFAIIPLSLHGLGWRGAVLPVVIGQAVVQLLMPLSPLPGGAAVAEVTFLALVAPTASVPVRTAALVLWRLFTWVAPVFAGFVALAVRQSHRGRRTASVAGPAHPPGSG